MLKICELYLKCTFVKSVRNIHHQKKLPQPIITCKRSEFNLLAPKKYGKFDEIPLASSGWHHKKSKGDHFIIHPNIFGSIYEHVTTKSFLELGIKPEIVNSIAKQGIRNPTQIQVDGIPKVLAGHNSLIAAETGCGKTLLYLLPVVQQIIQWKSFNESPQFNSPLALVVLPGRELAQQIGNIAKLLSDDLPFNTKVVVGGRTKQKMLHPSFEPIDLLVATLGSLSKLVTNGIYKMHQVHHVVLDEADTLLDDSFNEKLTYFLRKFSFDNLHQGPYGCQLTMASATLPTSLSEQIQGIVDVDSLQKTTSPNLHKTLSHVPQKFIRMGRSEKPAELLKLAKFHAKKHNPLIIFSNKSSTCDWVSMFLNENGVNCVNLNGDMPWVIRIGKFEEFQKGNVDIISCTDVGSRGLDTVRVKHVLNYDFPFYTADYIHRCGRTGRQGSPSNCHVTNFISGPIEVDLVQQIELSIRKQELLPKVNGNIAKIIQDKVERSLKKETSKYDDLKIKECASV